MLERASACVEPRIWCSRTTRKTASQSSRLLHSAFWNHGAGNLELPPCAINLSRDPLLASSNDRPTSSRTEAPFLDFLYPPQTLTLLQRPLNLFADNAGKRRTGPSHRKYSSSPLRMSRLRTTPDQSPLDVFKAEVKKVDESGSACKSASRNATELDRAVGRDDEAAQQGFDTAASLQASTTTQQLLRQKVDPEASLRNALATAKQDAAELKRIRALYKTLTSRHQESLDIKRQLIVWLDSLSQVAHRHRALKWQGQLMEQMPSAEALPDSQWTTKYCHAAVKHFLRLSDLESANALLQGAIGRKLEGDFGARALMRHLLRRQDWPVASKLFEDMRQYKEDGGDPVALQMLFRGFDMTTLLSHQESLMKWLSRQQRSGLDLSQRLHGRLLAQLVSYLQHADEKPRFQRSCSTLLNSIRSLSKYGHATAAEWEPLIMQLLTIIQPMDKALLSRLVADAWRSYSQSEGFRPSNTLMIRLLQAWKDHTLMRTNQTSISPGNDFSPAAIQATWLRFYSKLGYVPRSVLLQIHARNGEVSEVEELMRDYVSNLGGNDPDVDLFWPYIMVHGIRRDARGAQLAFDSLSSRFKVVPDVRCWDMLQYAYMRADDLDGAVHTFQQRLDAGAELSSQSITTLMVLHSKLGNADGVLSLMEQAELHKVAVTTHMKNALLLAHANAGEIKEAKEILRSTIKQHKEGIVTGSLTICFNSAMSMHARRREYSETIAIYRQMRDLDVKLDTESYGAIIVALCMRRTPAEAFKTLRKIMPADRITPTPFQFATIMTGFIRTKDYKEALVVWDYMRKQSIEPTISTRAAFIRAKALLEHSTTQTDVEADQSRDAKQELGPLKETIQELLEALDVKQRFGPESEFGVRNIDPSEAEGTLFESLIYLHGRRQCLDAAWELFQLYNTRHGKELATNGNGNGNGEGEPAPPPYRLTTAMMSVYYNAGQHDEVQNCWNLLVQQAVQSATIPESSTSADGRDPASSTPSTESANLDPAEHVVATTAVPKSSVPHNIAPGKRFLLSMPFRYYALSVLTSPGATADSVTALIRTFMSLLGSGWVFDNLTWNILIQRLCAMDPSRAMLAFSLAERFLTPQFPGWRYPRQIMVNYWGTQNFSKVAEQMEYMHYPRRYIAPGDRMPFYRTMVWLAYALLEIRRLHAIGLSSGGAAGQVLKAQVGSVSEIEARAPRTLEHVRNLPVVLDEIQKRLIRKGDEITQGGRWYGQV